MRISKGLDLPIAGAPVGAVGNGPAVASVALLGADYPGLNPAMRVEEGQRVMLGEPLFADRKRPEILFTSPASGIVSAINRGPRRTLVSVVVEIDGDAERTFPPTPEAELAALARGQAVETLLATGLWPALRTRPFGKVPDPASTPRSIFVTATDTNPLAPPPEAVIDAHKDDFKNGLTVVSRLTGGPVYLCKEPNVELPVSPAANLSVREFSGPHPAGLVGTHIHYLDPASAGRTVWHIGYQDVIAIGSLFTSGRLMTERTVALAGPAVKAPCLLRTRLGANLDDLVRERLIEGDNRVISGSVLSGWTAQGATAYLGHYHNQVSVIAEGRGAADPGLFGMKGGLFSIYRGIGFTPWGRRRFSFTSAAHGRPSAMVPFGGFERVMPLDILATQLLRALLTGDIEMAEALGCLELDEEDLALCTLVCPGKLEYGPLLRFMLERIEREG